MHKRICKALTSITLLGMIVMFLTGFVQALEVHETIEFESQATIILSDIPQVETQSVIFETTLLETEPTLEETVETMPTEPEQIVEKIEDIDADPTKIIEIDRLDDGTKIMRFKKGNYTIPNIPVNEMAGVSESGYVEKIYNVPHYLQQSYADTKYGNHGTVSSHGCGIASCAMVYSYLLDTEIMPDELAEKYGRYNTPVGSDYGLFKASAKDYGLEVKDVYNWQSVEEALKNGCIVIANVRKDTIFTQGGHFIVYYGITDDGKILVKDPSIYNYGEWSNIYLKEGFANGFDPKFVKYSFPCWIYSPKDLNVIASRDGATSAA